VFRGAEAPRFHRKTTAEKQLREKSVKRGKLVKESQGFENKGEINLWKMSGLPW
jgi:hypothetical protein